LRHRSIPPLLLHVSPANPSVVRITPDSSELKEALTIPKISHQSLPRTSKKLFCPTLYQHPNVSFRQYHSSQPLQTVVCCCCCPKPLDEEPAVRQPAAKPALYPKFEVPGLSGPAAMFIQVKNCDKHSPTHCTDICSSGEGLIIMSEMLLAFRRRPLPPWPIQGRKLRGWFGLSA
jgi:hypothetical protein